jgi:hypothetical protein
MGKQEQELFHELSYYTLDHPDKTYFIHQHIVDAFTAQTADITTKPIGIIFSLAGLYLYIEKNYSGKRVQVAHQQMASGKKEWPAISLPEERGEITVADVLASPPGKDRDAMIRKWCHSVWSAYKDSHPIIASLVGSKLLNVDL